jgi:class 3 adenylate cyclase/FixJ family two-component response regulator
MNKKPVIICVDDEKFILDTILKQVKREFGDEFDYEIAESAEEAIEIMEELQDDARELAMVISDQIMPGMKGEQFLTYVNTQNNETVKILLTGQASLESAINAINNANLYRYLTKPWQENDLLFTIKKGIEEYKLRAKNKKQAKIFSQFVPQEFLDALNINDIENVKLGDSTEKSMVIMFSDIRDFTTKSEAATPQENFDFINKYLSIVEPCITRNKGFIDKYIGDAIMALFYSEDDALKSSLEIYNAINVLNEENLYPKHLPLSIGTGMHCGKLMLGVVGGLHRLQGSVFSDAVNTAARLQNITKNFKCEMIVSDAVIKNLKTDNLIHTRSLGKVLLRGKKEVTELFEVITTSDKPHFRKKIDSKKLFEESVVKFNDKEFSSALSGFEAILKENEQDKPAYFFKQECLKALSSKTPESNTGIIEFE